ncbi:MAG: carbon storage regulator CsrA [Actinomycetota bacterium]|nr:carbon storage regulator CsrA [Actinomycetota bacterium]
MLVLSRRIGESVMIGSNVRVTVVDARGDQIRLGIDAPRSIAVHREEVFRQVQDANSAAAASTDRNSPLLSGKRREDRSR